MLQIRTVEDQFDRGRLIYLKELEWELEDDRKVGRANMRQQMATSSSSLWEATMKRDFDAIVIGSGLGGLVAGALYARAGRRLLILERNDSFGGAATVYRHGALSIEASLHEMDGLDDDDSKLPLFRALGLDRDLQFVTPEDLYEVRGAIIGEPFVLPHGGDAALSAAVARFPRHEAGLKEFFARVNAARAAVSFLFHHQDDGGVWWLTHAPQAVRRLWPLIREGRATVGAVMQELFGADEAVKAALAANLGYYDDDPDRMLFLRYAMAQGSFTKGGGHYVRGGSQALSDRLVSLICEANGVAEAGREADAILIEGGSVVGVGHRARSGGDQRIDYAPVVFGNAAPHVLAAMLPEAERAVFLAPYTGRKLSISLWSLSIGLSRPPREFGVTHFSTFIFPAWMKQLSEYRASAAIMGEEPGVRLPLYVFVDFDRIDSGLNNRDGLFLGQLVSMDRVENWEGLSPDAERARKERWMDRLIGDLDREFPGIAGAIRQRELSTAKTMRHYLNTPDGAVYGFAPDAFTFKPRTMIGGLWLASSFTGAGGFTGAMLGGAMAAREAVRQIRSANG
jgi:phytoene dehydrogenase-like protein